MNLKFEENVVSEYNLMLWKTYSFEHKTKWKIDLKKTFFGSVLKIYEKDEISKTLYKCFAKDKIQKFCFSMPHLTYLFDTPANHVGSPIQKVSHW